MRARNLKPSIFKNEYLARLAPDSYRAYTGLWCLADRKGRLEDRPDRIEAELFPFKFQRIDMEKILTSLENTPEPFILRYCVNEKRYIQIINFEKHQFPHVKEQESTIPAPDSHGASTGVAHLNPPSPFPLPESLKDSCSPAVNDGVPFSAFYDLYPKKQDKAKAEELWKKLSPARELWVEKIRPALERQASSEEWLKEGGRFVPMPSTWLRRRRWEDEIKSAPEERLVL